MTSNRKALDLKDKKFNSLYVESYSHQEGVKRFWNCICDCGTKLCVHQRSLVKDWKKSCGCKNKGNQNPGWTGHEEISGQYWNSIKRGARERDFEFSITIEYVWEIFLNQDRKCALSGQLLILNQSTLSRNKGYSKHTASLDRIDSSKGYVEGNVQWVHKDINRMKQEFSEEYFIDTCEKIVTSPKKISEEEKLENMKNRERLTQEMFYGPQRHFFNQLYLNDDC